MVLEQGFSNSAPSAMCSKEKHVVVHHSIQHSDLEHKIFETLKAVLIHFELDTQIRVAGGWVRDKVIRYQESVQNTPCLFTEIANHILAKNLSKLVKKALPCFD